MAEKILLVDDDMDTLRLVGLMLQRQGYEIRAANNGPQAITLAEQDLPDLILLDVMMPDGTEGFQFVWKLRNEFPAELADTPIIVLSAIHGTTKLRFYPEQSDGTYRSGEFLPVQGFIDKPAEPEMLLKRIEQVLQMWRK